jgi:hypothetical protein
LNSLLLEAGECVAVGHFAGLLAAERRANPSVWHPGVSPSIFWCCRFGDEFKKLHCVDFPEEILQEEEADRGQTLSF